MEARRKFLGLLPEVNKRRLYERRGFISIFEFAAKLAGISQEQVRNVLNLERQFCDKAILQTLLISGEVSVNKLVRVASIATTENQNDLAEKVKNLPNRALEIVVKEIKYGDQIRAQNGNQNGCMKPIFSDAELRVQPAKDIKRDINSDLKLLEKLSPELKNKLHEMLEKGLDINEILLELLAKREQEITEQKEQIAGQYVAEQKNAGIKRKSPDSYNSSNHSLKPASNHTYRYIPVAIKKIIHQEFGCKCAIPGCKSQARQLHHTARFAISQSHNPHYLAPLCPGHHTLAHAVDAKVRRFSALGSG